MIPAVFSSKWFWVVAGAVAGIVVAISLIQSFGNARYNEGKLEERAKWEQVLADAREAQTEAQRQIDGLSADLRRASAERDQIRARMLSQVQEVITNAPDAASQYSAYVDFRQRLRTPTADRLARARANFLPAGSGDGQ